MVSTKPYISFVVVGRNDDYGHNFLGRFQNFLDNLAYFLEKYSIPSELIIVEWNPPEGKKRLNSTIKIPSKRKYLKIRFIEVQKRIHDKIKNPLNLPLLEYIGKNVGIRRSNGKFILCTNPDILFNEEFYKYIQKRNLKNGELYRTKRHDLTKDIPQNLSEEEKIKFCENNYSLVLGTPYNHYRVRKFLDLIKFLDKEIKNLGKFLLNFTEKYCYIKYMGGAPGDFTLMSKKDWFKCNGYIELPLKGYIDNYLIAIASSIKKIKLINLPKNIKAYHQFHGISSINGLTHLEDCKKNIRKIIKGEKIFKIKEFGGLKKEKLKEKVF